MKKYEKTNKNLNFFKNGPLFSDVMKEESRDFLCIDNCILFLDKCFNVIESFLLKLDKKKVENSSKNSTIKNLIYLPHQIVVFLAIKLNYF